MLLKHSLKSLHPSRSGVPVVVLCTAHFQVKYSAHANKPAKNRCVSHTETEERAKTEPFGINISGAGDKFYVGLV